MRRRKKKIEKLSCTHQDPVKRGLVEDQERWPWNSYAFYQRRGDVLIDIDLVD